MAHSNGRIYTEIRSGVTYGVTTADVAAVLGVSSLDVATLCRASNINLWAKYRPLPLSRTDRGTPGALTDSARRERNYGINFQSRWQINSQYDMPPKHMAHSVNRFDGNAYDIKENDMLCVPLEWNEGVPHWYNLLDFVRVGDNGNVVPGTGYNHAAVAVADEVTLNGSTYAMHGPLFPIGLRDLTIEDGQDYNITLPNDLDFLRAMYSGGTLTPHEEVLSVMDVLMSIDNDQANHQLYQSDSAYARRCVQLICTEETQYPNGVANKIAGKSVLVNESDIVGSINFGTTSVIQLDSAWDDRDYNHKPDPDGVYDLAKVSGKLWVAEYYKIPNLISHVPIPGYVYSININRVAAGAASVDIPGTLYFDVFDEYLFIIINEGISLKTFLAQNYGTLTLTIGDVTLNLLTLPVTSYGTGELITAGGYRGWYRYAIDPGNAFAQYSGSMTATVASIKAGQTARATKQIQATLYQ